MWVGTETPFLFGRANPARSDRLNTVISFRPGSIPPAITTPTRAALLAEVEARLRGRQGFALATLNLDHLVKLGRDPAFRAAYAAQTHVVADGNPVVWLQRLAGNPVDLVPGSELVEPLAALAGRLGVPVALLGSTADILALAATRLQVACPGLTVVARLAPPQGFDPAGPAGEAALRDLAASGARLCFLALGAPKQEILAARGRDSLPEVGFVSIGAGLDFIAGSQTRAPLWLRRLALEWAWRLMLSPGRLARRYLDCALILPGLALHAWRARHRPGRRA
jgi:N-acetylglucosaminyldiphosphoundecaprenol N-acetyl-beta-D-mannosaminyltransferase